MININILNYIESNCLVKINADDEKLFTTRKVPIGFFIYLVIKLEEHYKIVFDDGELVEENFDSVDLIKSTIKKHLGTH